MEVPETCYVRGRGAYIAYRVIGDGSVDVLLQGGFSHVELQLDEPSFATAISSFIAGS